MGPAGFEPATRGQQRFSLNSVHRLQRSEPYFLDKCALRSRSTSAPQAELQPHRIRKPDECF